MCITMDIKHLLLLGDCHKLSLSKCPILKGTLGGFVSTCRQGTVGGGCQVIQKKPTWDHGNISDQKPHVLINVSPYSLVVVAVITNGWWQWTSGKPWRIWKWIKVGGIPFGIMIFIDDAMCNTHRNLGNAFRILQVMQSGRGVARDQKRN